MQKLIQYSVNLFDPTTFELRPGVEEFTHRYQPYTSDRRTFSFPFASAESQRAATDLRAMGLPFLLTYGIKLAPNEIKNYPAFLFAIPLEYDLLVPDSSPAQVNAQKLGKFGIAEDFSGRQIILTPQFLDKITEFGVSVDVKSVQTTKGRSLWLTSHLPKLPDPYEVLNTVKITENIGDSAGTFDAVGFDERFQLSPASLEFLAQYHLGHTDKFIYQGHTYRKSGNVHFVSGTLADWLQTTYYDMNCLVPVVLKSVWAI